MDGVEEDHVLLARFQRARLHRDRQLDDGLDGAEAELEVGLPSIAVQKVKFWKRIWNQMRQGGLTLPTGRENPFEANSRFIFGSGRDMAIFRKST